jgi:hypothetical protein
MTFDMVLLSSKWIDNIEIAVSIEEQYNDELTIVDHPVENGAQISDHAYRRPSEVILQCGWSNADYKALLGASQTNFNGTLSNPDYVNGVYSRLLALQQRCERFNVTTSRRRYSNMLIAGLAVSTDVKNRAALIVKATLREILVVDTKATTLAPRANQAQPAATSELQDQGTKQLAPANPAPGGASPPDQWR